MRKVRRTIIELLVIVVGGFLIGLTANAMNPDGIAIGRDHFSTGRKLVNANHRQTTPAPEATPSADASRDQIEPPTGEAQTSDTETAAQTGTESPAPEPTPVEATDPEPVQAEDSPFRFLPHDDVVQLYHTDAYIERRIVFIDARDDNHFTEGHIPGALQLDHYRVDRYMDNLLPFCQNAEQIVVYCTGGECEDSQFAAYDLLEYGIDPAKICIYAEGIDGWRDAGMPIELDESNSGHLE